MQGWASELQRFAVGKKIASCLSTVSCQHTLDHLMYEISQLLHETDDPSVTKAFTESASRVRPMASSAAVIMSTYLIESQTVNNVHKCLQVDTIDRSWVIFSRPVKAIVTFAGV